MLGPPLWHGLDTKFYLDAHIAKLSKDTKKVNLSPSIITSGHKPSRGQVAYPSSGMHLHRSRENPIPHSFTHVHRNPRKSCNRSLGTPMPIKISGRRNNLHALAVGMWPRSCQRMSAALTLVSLWLSSLPKSGCPCPCTCKGWRLEPPPNHGVFDRLYILGPVLHRGPWSRTMKDGILHGPTWWSNLYGLIP